MSTTVFRLEASSIIAGMCFALSSDAMLRYGVSVTILSDKNRQKTLNFVTFLGSICAFLYLGYGFSHENNKICTAFAFLADVCVNFGLCAINHNTVVRFYLAFSKNPKHSERVNKLCLLIYPLMFIVLIPIYMALHTTTQDGSALINTHYNDDVYKPMLLALAVLTEFFATISDLVLLRKMAAGRQNYQPSLASGTNSMTSGGKNKELVHRVWSTYVVIWLAVILDTVDKSVMVAGLSTFCDTPCSLLTLVLRAKANLEYGSTLKLASTGKTVDLGTAQQEGTRVKDTKVSEHDV